MIETEKIKKLSHYMLTFYIIAGILLWTLLDVKKAYLYRLQRDDSWAMYPVEHSAHPIKSNHSIPLRRGLRYYKILVSTFPDLSQAYGMIGYCYYYLGKDDRAIAAYSKAVEKMPGYFWHHYNLGVIYYNRQDYKKAAEYFKYIASQNIQEIIISAMYNPLKRLPKANQDLLFKTAQKFAISVYNNAQEYLILCFVEPSQRSRIQVPGELIIHPWVRDIPVGKEIYFLYEEPIYKKINN